MDGDNGVWIGFGLRPGTAISNVFVDCGENLVIVTNKSEESSDKSGEAKPTEPPPEPLSDGVKVDGPPERLDPRPDEVADDSTAKTSDKSGVEDSDSDEPYPKVKALRPGEDIEDHEVVAVNAVRVEVWRHLFDAKTNVVQGKRLKQATAKVPAQ